jgi:hypothetical protein
MKKAILLILFQAVWTAGFPQSLPFIRSPATYISSTNLIVRWAAPSQPWPGKLWTYQVVPRRFPPKAMSYLMSLSSFTDQDKRDFWPSGTNGVIFEKPFTSLTISFDGGEVEYSGRYHKELSVNVPATNQLVQLTTNLFQKLGINPSDIARGTNGDLQIRWNDPDESYSFYYPGGGVIISNIQSRMVYVRRALDGVRWAGDGGNARIDFGERAVIDSLWLYWRNVARDKSYASATPENIGQWIREGKAIQRHQADGFGFPEAPIDWSTAKSLTITNACPCYWADSFGRQREGKLVLPSAVYPYAEISGMVESASGNNVHVEIMCPVINEKKPL